jgi:hypothetical protein
VPSGLTVPLGCADEVVDDDATPEDEEAVTVEEIVGAEVVEELARVDPADEDADDVAEVEADDEVELKGDTLRAGRYQLAGGSPIHSPMGTATSYN